MTHAVLARPGAALRAFCALTLLLFLDAPTHAAEARAGAFTIRQVLSAPFPSGLTAAPRSGRVAWVYNRNGVRNVWVADAEGANPRAITGYTADDGCDLGGLAWNVSGSEVFYTRGGSLAGGGPVNTMSLPQGAPRQEIWAASIDGAEPRLIGPGHSPAPSPSGDLVAYLFDNQIWTALVSGQGQRAQLIHDRGRSGSIAWSPDGSRLAFVSSRGAHSLIGIYDFASRTIRWLSPSVDSDRDPQWSPDSRRLAFLRIPAGANDHILAQQREGEPWSIWVGDAVTGDARPVWTASRGPGSVFQGLQSGANLIWGAKDRIVFPWERTGWTQLYSIPASGGPAQWLTPGEGEVWNAAVASGGDRIVYSSNQGDIDRRHLWQVFISGGAPTRLTDGDGIEDYPAVASDGRLVALHSDGRNPIRPISVDGARMRDLVPAAIPADFPASQLVEPRQVLFPAADGHTIHGQLFLPPTRAPKRGPALLFFHGGPARQMLLGWHPMHAYALMYGMNQYLANQGYVVLSVNYRGGTGYGLNFREAEHFGPYGASEYADIVGAARFLGARTDVDPKRIGAWGGSYGGQMSALGLSRASELVAAAVDYAGIHDWKRMLENMRALGLTANRAQLAYDSSVMATIGQWRSPVLLVHADDDRNVPFDQTVEMVKSLRKQGVDVEQLVLADEVHDLLRHQSWLTLFTASDHFFRRTLMLAGPAAADSVHAELVATAGKLRDQAMRGDTIAVDFVRELTTRFGPRPAGSSNEQAAAVWAAKQFEAMGFEQVRVQEFPITGWKRGLERVELVLPDGGRQPLVAVALGESPPTPAAGIEAEVVLFRDLESLQASPAGSLTGKIAVIDRPMPATRDGSGYGPISRIRGDGPDEAAKKGAVAFMLRSAGTGPHRIAHTGSTRYVGGKVQIPAFALSIPDAEQLARLAALGRVNVRLYSAASYVPDARSQNVVAEIRGSERPEEIVLLAAHLDSWDLGTGAIDDGAGAAIITAAIKLINDLPRRPRRTVRVVLYGAEEVAQPNAPFGVFGGHAYATARKNEIVKHIIAGESDFGADRIYALKLPAGADDFAKLVKPVMSPLGVAVLPEAAVKEGADIRPLLDAGVPTFNLSQDATRYFDLHHTADDTFDKIDPTQLNQNVAAWAALVWLIADSGIDFRALAAKSDTGHVEPRSQALLTQDTR